MQRRILTPQQADPRQERRSCPRASLVRRRGGPALELQPVDEQGHCEQVCRAAGAEIACHEGLMNIDGSLTPCGATDASPGKESGCTVLRETQTVQSAPMQ